ncbi:3'-5' exonuclease [Vibrio neptunius]|uniref:DNA-directed DNA polymerase n=1 Tax=Vibrio neptunius TaxID=170651 RepID=A0ABS3A4B5_9VIBR|nr:3'-5' exonuclease [Vibrio neptunius]MBN3494063.1 3'-5' exonuclease [Vibrio neptunius]MBN3516560.1 3'-5' exonuclease [Vibrio neptunius]MBN3550734.1 3'-5' exonuclease [Vibrio neptunius]MBN3578865.1 3'-5' exonuclease [Vibrio neptunius]MCH9872530.1 3'-5' exonuclease [Vibrio neptunius]
MIKNMMRKPTIDWGKKFEAKQKTSRNDSLQRYYHSGLPTADTHLEDVTFLAMDFETTGLDSSQDDIITIGTVPFNLNRIFINQAHHWTVRPRQQLAEESVIIHGITHSDILDAPDLSEVYDQVLQQMAGKIMVVHYQRIEREFFDQALKDRINEGIEFPVVDTMHLETLHQQRLHGGILNKVLGKKPDSVRLGASRTRYGLPPYTPHHALTDAVATAELLQAQIAYHYQRSTTLGQIWL